VITAAQCRSVAKRGKIRKINKERKDRRNFNESRRHVRSAPRIKKEAGFLVLCTDSIVNAV
jgi:hypothetical protein